jgi:hypothetical protein
VTRVQFVWFCKASSSPAHTDIEFSGTLLGFDDYVSKYANHAITVPDPNGHIDMVLGDVTELQV